MERLVSPEAVLKKPIENQEDACQRAGTPDLSVPVDIINPPSVQVLKTVEKAPPKRKRSNGNTNNDDSSINPLIAKNEVPQAIPELIDNYVAPPSVMMVGE